MKISTAIMILLVIYLIGCGVFTVTRGSYSDLNDWVNVTQDMHGGTIHINSRDIKIIKTQDGDGAIKVSMRLTYIDDKMYTSDGYVTFKDCNRGYGNIVLFRDSMKKSTNNEFRFGSGLTSADVAAFICGKGNELSNK